MENFTLFAKLKKGKKIKINM